MKGREILDYWLFDLILGLLISLPDPFGVMEMEEESGEYWGVSV